MEESKSYALENLKAWVEEALDSDVTPEELYNTIRTTVVERISYHNICVHYDTACYYTILWYISIHYDLWQYIILHHNVT